MTTQSNEINQNQAYHYDWAEGFKKSLPVAMGYLPAGIAFGVLAQVAGVPVWGTIMLSVVLYAGAAQYAVGQAVAFFQHAHDAVGGLFALFGL